tara:strand:+ start:1533 stop:2651 length:1119 start_codon:yes stop_codon:yes gene_type:complete
MEQNLRPSSVEIASNFEDVFKTVSEVDNTVIPTTPVEPVSVVGEVITTTPVNTQPDFQGQTIPAEEQVEPVIPNTTEYKKRLDSLIEDGFMENFSIEVVDENGEKQSVFLSDLEDVDSEVYKTILSNYKEAKDTEIKEKYISKEGIDEITEKFIEIRRAGGDTTLMESNMSEIQNLEKLKANLSDNEQLQINIVATDLKSKNLSDNVIQAQIRDYIENLQLDTEAEKIVDSHLAAHSREVELKSQQELQRLDQEKEVQKKIRKDLATTYKDWKLPESLQKVLVENSTKIDREGLTNTERLFFEAVKDPSKLAKLAFLLNDEKGYEDFFASKKVLQSKTDGLKPMFQINLSNTKQVKNKPLTVEDNFKEIFKN